MTDHEGDEYAPTVMMGGRGDLLPASKPPPSVPAALATPDTVSGLSLTATAAIREEQVVRGLAIVRIGACVGLVAAILLQLPVAQDPVGRLVATMALLLISGSSSVLLIANRFGHPVGPKQVFRLSLIITPSILAVLWHTGVMSPTVMALIFGIYYFGQSDDKRQGWVNYAIASLGFALITALTVTRVIPADRALFPLTELRPTAVMGMAFVVELMLTVTFWLSRLSRRATLDAIVTLETARRQIEQRDVWLDEAAADLDAAVGAGKRGHYSGRQLGDWLTKEVIGRGAMGEVYRAQGPNDAKAAIKVLHPFFIDSSPYVERFLREAQVSSALHSPHIVELFGHGKTPDGCPYIVMDLLEGHDLQWHLRRRPRFALKEVIVLVNEIAQALTVAQDEGIVHRDIKPNNVVRDERGKPTWKVLDFGVSKIRASSGTLTHGDIVGTPAYMAPEQAKQGEVDHRADVFSLGAIAYRAITGRPAFAADEPIAILYRVAHTQPNRPSALVRLPEDIDLVLALALAKDQDRRLRSASSFAAALRDAARSELDERFREDARALLVEQPWELPSV